MDKSNLLKVLDENGLFAEYDDLYRDEVTVRDWVSRNEDLVRSNRAIAQAIQVDAPHDVKAGYFKDKDEQRQYEAGEKKYNEERAKKQQLADEYKRSKESSYFNTFAANEYAKQQAIKGNKAKALANEVAAKLGFISDFTPPPFSYAGPAIRYFQRGLNEDKWDPTDVEVLADVGTSVFGPAKGAAKTGYQVAREVAGPALGKVFDTSIGKWIERGVNAVDAKTAQKALNAERKAISNKVDDFINAFNNEKLDDEAITNFATEIADKYPELATKLIDRTNALAKSRRTVQEAELAAKYKSKDATKREAESILAERKSAEADKALSDELFETQKKAQDEYLYGGKPLFDEEKRLIRENADLLRAQKLANESKGSAAVGQIAKAVSKPAVKKVTHAYPDSKERDFDKEYSSAIEYIIQSNKRQWNAGFKPHGGIELEAWQIAKDRGEI
jgi:hypothetical protein